MPEVIIPKERQGRKARSKKGVICRRSQNPTATSLQKLHVRKQNKINATAERPFGAFLSEKNIYAQLIDDKTASLCVRFRWRSL
jgi:hypothetical protein